MKPSTAPGNHSFAAENKRFEKSHAGIENIENTGNKKGFWGFCLISPIKNAARYIADGIRTVFRNIRSFLITVCSPSGSCFRKGKSASSGQDSLSSVERDAGRVQHDIGSRQVEFHEQPALTEPVSQDTDDLSALSGRARFVSSHQETEGFIKRQALEEPYGAGNSTGPTLPSWTRQSDVSTPSVISSGAAARPVHLPYRETSAALPSVGISEGAFSAGTDAAMTREDTGRALQVDAAPGRVEPHNQSAFDHPVDPVHRAAGDVTTLPDNVKVVISNHGIEDIVKRKCPGKPYGVVNSIDKAGRLQHGVSCVIKNLAGSGYARATLERQTATNVSDRLNYGQCVVYDIHRDCLNKPAGLDDKWRTIYNVLVPYANDPYFETHLKNSFLIILEKSSSNGTACIVFPMLGCGRAGGTSSQLAQVIFDARCEFVSRHPHCQLPEMILASTGSTADKYACMDFENKWRELHNRRKVSEQPVTEPDPAPQTRQPDASIPSDISFGAAARPVHWPSRETPADLSSDVIPESALPAKTGEITRKHTDRDLQVKATLTRTEPRVRPSPARPISQNAHRARRTPTATYTLASRIASPVTLVYNTDLKLFVENQEAQSREGRGFAYGVVSPVDETGQLQHGAARVVKDMAGDWYAQAILDRQDTRESGVPMEYGQTGTYSFSPEDEAHRSSGLDHWHVVLCARFLPASDPKFDEQLKNTVLQLLDEAYQEGLSRIIFPFSSCDKEIYGTGSQLAEAIYVAAYSFQYNLGTMPPEVFLVGADMNVLTEGCQFDEEFRARWRARERV